MIWRKKKHNDVFVTYVHVTYIFEVGTNKMLMVKKLKQFSISILDLLWDSQSSTMQYILPHSTFNVVVVYAVITYDWIVS